LVRHLGSCVLWIVNDKHFIRLPGEFTVKHPMAMREIGTSREQDSLQS
jgi:hypothetical protein